MIPAEQLLDIRARNELVAFIEAAGVKLRRQGTSYLGLCPFHPDRNTPSLAVSPKKQYWCCHGACSPAGGKRTGGDVIEFARRLWGVSFLEAVARLADQPPPLQRSAPRSAPLRIDHLAEVARIYQQMFGASAAAKDYCTSRGIQSADLVGALGIGYSDGTLVERAPQGSETRRELEALGIITESGRELLAGCVVVPLRDLSGQIVNFYGRPIESDGHYFLPGPRRGLVNAAGVATSEEIIITESVIDAISFLEAGVSNVVPIYGVHGWTSDHEALLQAHRIRRVIVALDTDAAGQNGAQALVHKLSSTGLDVRNVLLPAKDANELLVSEGPAVFAEIWRELILPAKPKTEPQQGGEQRKENPNASITAHITAPGQDEVITFASRTYRVRGLTAVGVSRMRVTLRVEQEAKFHVDSFDLYSARGRRSFMDAAAEALALGENDAAAIGAELGQIIDLLERQRLALRARETAQAEAPVEMSAEDRAAALTLLSSPSMVERICTDLAALGCVGEDDSLLIAYLAALSRKLAEPLSVLFCARSGAGKSTLQDRICEITPPEDLVSYTSVTGRALFYADENALRHKLLAIDEEDGASEAAYALRCLQSSGQLSTLYTRSDPQTGKQKAEQSRVYGPTSTFCTTAHPEAMDFETRNRFLLLTVNESKEQTRRILERQRWNFTIEGLRAREGREAILRRHQNAQRLVLPMHVVIPDAIKLPYPWEQLILRREHKKYLTLICTIALVHQHQRVKQTDTSTGKPIEYIEAMQRDADLANKLVPGLLRRNLDELSPPSRTLAQQIYAMVMAKKQSEPASRGLFDRKQLQRFTGLSVWHIKAYLGQLIEYEYIAPVVGKKGRRYLYELLWDGTEDETAGSQSNLAETWRELGGENSAKLEATKERS